MRLGNSMQAWGTVAKLLHWLIALMILGQFATGWLAENETNREAGYVLIRNHFQFGVLLTGLILMRVLWRLSHRPPEPPPGEPPWRDFTARAVHGLIYLLLITLPIAGYIVWVHMKAEMDVFGLFAVPALFTPPVEDERLRATAWYVHFYAGWALIGLIGLHIAAALFHQFILRDGLIRRITA